MNEKVTLRLATMNDADVLLEWRNDLATRGASHDTSEVSCNDHTSWLSRTLSDSNRKLYVAEVNGNRVGCVRADFSDGAWILSWTVSSTERRKGVAKRMVGILANQITDPIKAEVKAENIASARVAEYVGMKINRDADGILHFKRAALERKHSSRSSY